MSRDIPRADEKSIKHIIHRAFLTGQKYITINIPFDHIKLVSYDDI